MNREVLKNGASGKNNDSLESPAPKTDTDQKIARHFNRIVFIVLAVLALGILIAIWIFHHRGEKIILHADQKKSAQQ